MEGVAKVRVAKSVFPRELSYINATKLSLSTIKMPRSSLFVDNVVSLNVLESGATTELEVVDYIMRL
jgi:hypothetical protein